MADVLSKDDILEDGGFDEDDDVPELVSVAQNLTLESPTPLAPFAAAPDTAANDITIPPLTATTATTRPASSIPFKPCPVTILSGFLGSGKTTLIQHLLQSPDHGKRIAVIENEYGDGSLDTTAAAAATTLSLSSSTAKDGLQRSIESLIAQDSSKQNYNSLSDWIELPNGCLCCTVKDKLVTTLEHLITIKGDELDCILIEMSGMALPGPLASLFWLDDDVENDTPTTAPTTTTTAFDATLSTSSIHSRLRLDGIITVVDAYHVDSQLQTTFEAACQIAQADRILVNKMDLLPSAATGAVDDILSTLRQINPTALVQTTSYGRVPDWNWIFDIHSLDMDHQTLQHVEEVWSHQTKEDDQLQAHVDHDTVCTDANCQESHDHSHDHHDDHRHHHHEDEHTRIPKKLHKQQQQHAHTSGVSTITLSHHGSVDLAQLNKWVASILWPHQDEADKVLRARLEQSLLQRQEPSLSTDFDNDVATTPATTKGHDKQDDSTTPQIFRIKGVLSVRKPLNHLDEEEDLRWIDPLTGLDRRYYILQAVHDLWEIHPSQNEQFLWNDGDDDRCCKLIVIGRYMDAPSLRASFEECAV